MLKPEGDETRATGDVREDVAEAQAGWNAFGDDKGWGQAGCNAGDDAAFAACTASAKVPWPDGEEA